MAKRVARTISEKPATRGDTLEAVRRAAASCTRCDLYRHATQTVFGSGAPHADVMLVGEQPGDVEDREGEPFVGPAGQLLRRSLDEAGLDLGRVYLTNAVKHFKWKPRGKRRIHDKPNHEEVLACHLWLEQEIARVRPRVLVALGATAASALFGPSVRVMRDRATWLESSLAELVTVTVHPSSILRAPDSESRAKAHGAFVADLKVIVARLGGNGRKPAAKGSR
jgi:uracil-DNA glycosylase